MPIRFASLSKDQGTKTKIKPAGSSLLVLRQMCNLLSHSQRVAGLVGLALDLGKASGQYVPRYDL